MQRIGRRGPYQKLSGDLLFCVTRQDVKTACVGRWEDRLCGEMISRDLSNPSFSLQLNLPLGQIEATGDMLP